MVQVEFNSKIKLNNGSLIPILGLGTLKEKENESYKAVKMGIDVGYRYIDTARLYLNENEVGRAINEKIDEGSVKRSDLFVTSKIWVNEMQPYRVIPALKSSLSRLNLEYIDMYLIHWPAIFKPESDLSVLKLRPEENVQNFDYNFDYRDTWKEMEKIPSLGLAKGIGVSNFNSEQIQNILDICKIPPAINQVECHPYYQQEKLYDFCHQNGILMTGFSPLGSSDWKPGKKLLINDSILDKIGKKYGKSVAQVSIRWGIEKGIVIIPRSKLVEQLKENFDIWDFELSIEDHQIIKSLEKKERIHWYSGGKFHKDYPFHAQF